MISYHLILFTNRANLNSLQKNSNMKKNDLIYPQLCGNLSINSIKNYLLLLFIFFSLTQVFAQKPIKYLFETTCDIESVGVDSVITMDTTFITGTSLRTGAPHEGLIAYLPLDWGGANDAVIKELSGFYTGAPNNNIFPNPDGTFNFLTRATDACGNSQNAAGFIKNTSSTINMSHSDVFKTKEISISFWFKKKTEEIVNSEKEGFISKGREYNIYLSGNNNPFDLKFEVASNEILSSRADIEANQFYHVVVTMSLEKMIIYFDGEKRDSTFFRGGLPSDISDTANFNFGRYIGPTTILDGTMDEVRIYNRPLTEEEVTTLYQLPCTPGEETKIIGLCDGDVYKGRTYTINSVNITDKEMIENNICPGGWERDIFLNVTNPLSTQEIDTSICSGDSYQIDESIYTQSGIYRDTFVVDNECRETITNLAILPFEVRDTTGTICEGEELIFRDTTFSISGNYIIRDKGNCDSIVYNVNVIVDNTSSECTELIFYDGFTPNGDGDNDEFEIDNYFVDSQNDDKAQLRIFNRSGEEVFTSNMPYENNWNGTNNAGKNLPEGNYIYIFDSIRCSDKCSGRVLIVR